MGNTIGNRKKAKVMKIDGEMFKLKTPIRAGEIVKDYPGHVLIESEAVKQYGIRAKPLEPQQELNPKRIYFLIELPKFPQEKGVPRRVRSGIQMTAKDRLESLMLSRRSVSDLSAFKSSNSIVVDETGGRSTVRMRLPRSEVMRLVGESRDSTEAAEKIMDLFVENKQQLAGRNFKGKEIFHGDEHEEIMNQWKPSLGSITETFKNREKRRVGFMPMNEGEMAY